jgi:vitamin B12 transporter
MGRRVSGVIVAATLAASLQAANAQDAVQAPTQVLPQIVVSPTTIPTPADQVASSVTVMTDEYMRRQQLRTVPDALKAVPGLNVVQTGGPGGQTSVFIRGTNSNQVKVLIDGIDASDPSIANGAFDFGHLLTGGIDRIEILRGPQSGLYGADAMGGVISITTKKGSGPPKVNATVEGGSFSQFNQTLGASGAVGNFNYAFNVLHFRSVTPVTPLNLLAPGETRNDDTYDNWTYSTKLGADLSEDFSVNGVVRYTDAKLGTTGDSFALFPLTFPEALQSTTTNHNLYSRGEAIWSLFDGRFKNYFGVNYTDQKNSNINPNTDFAANFGFASPTVAPPFATEGKRTKIDWRGEATLAPGQLVVLGLEHQKDELRTDSTGFVDAGFNFFQTLTTASNWNNAGFAELQSQVGKRFFVVANVRDDDNQSFGQHATWRVAPVFIVPITETKLKATYGTGYKAPTLFELYANNPALITFANPALKPETSKGYDYGFEQSVWENRLSFGATYFRNDIKNLITAPFNPLLGTFGGFQSINIGQAKTSGAEAFLAVVPVATLKLRADYTYTQTRDEITGLGLMRRPRDKVSLTSSWTPIDPLNLSATIIYVSGWVDTDRTGTIPRLNAPPYTLVNLAANYDVDKRVTLFGRIDNLFNKQYQEPTGYMRPGFGAFGGVRVAAEVPGQGQ